MKTLTLFVLFSLSFSANASTLRNISFAADQMASNPQVLKAENALTQQGYQLTAIKSIATLQDATLDSKIEVYELSYSKTVIDGVNPSHLDTKTLKVSVDNSRPSQMPVAKIIK